MMNSSWWNGSDYEIQVLLITISNWYWISCEIIILIFDNEFSLITWKWWWIPCVNELQLISWKW